MKVYLNKQDTLMIQVGEQTINDKTIPTIIEVGYDDIMLALQKCTKRDATTRKSKNAGTLLSRKVSLLCRAIETGKWSSGASVSQPDCVRKLHEILCDMTTPERLNLTPKVKKRLSYLAHNPQVACYTHMKEIILRLTAEHK